MSPLTIVVSRLPLIVALLAVVSPLGSQPAAQALRTIELAPRDSAGLRERLSRMQWHVTQESGTEPAFSNEYWDNDEPGIYVDVVSGEPLFSSLDKYDSGTGWPSFTRPLAGSSLDIESGGRSGALRADEVRGRRSDAHLGHVFNDGPGPTGERYCMNSAALRFIPASRLREEGYGEYVRLFE